jgi:hypothetical protein
MDKPYVSYCDDSIKLKNVGKTMEGKIIELGGKQNGPIGEYLVPLGAEAAKPRLFSILRELGFAFSAGREWSPAEQFEELREKGLLQGKFSCVIWRGPNNYSISEK